MLFYFRSFPLLLKPIKIEPVTRTLESHLFRQACAVRKEDWRNGIGTPITQHKHARVHSRDNCLIFGSMPPRKKTRWRTITKPMLTALAHSQKHKYDINVCWACPYPCVVHSRPQRPRSFWSAPRIRPLARSNNIPVLNGFVSAIDWDQNQSDWSNLTLSMRRVAGGPWIADFWCWTWPEVAILGSDQKERGL